LALIGIHIQPDLVIDYEGWNDTGSSIAWNYRTDHSHYFSDLDPDSVGVVQRFLPAWALSVRVIALATFVLENWLGINDLGSYVTKFSLPWPDMRLGLQRTLNNFRTIHSIARGQGAETIFATFQFFQGSSFATIPLLEGSWSRSDAYRRFFDANGFLYVDQDLLIPDGDRTIQYDDGHFTAKGEKMMAQNFFDYIVARKLVVE
jgi:hypothetical protein